MSARGLTTAQAKSLLEKHGPNLIAQKETTSPFSLLVEQFTSPLIIVLCVACVATFVIGDHIDAGVIGLAILVNTSLGFFQEFKAQNALKALSKVLSPAATVYRDGKIARIPLVNIVPGDMVFIEAGDQVAADGVFLETHHLSINEAILTGESRPVLKAAAKKKTKTLVRPQDENAQYCCYMGTTCLNGSGVYQVMATGKETQVGKIAKQLSTVKESLTPLQKKLEQFSQKLTIFILGLCLCVFALGTLLGNTPLEMLKLSVAIAVSAIPEGLVISLTIILAIGMQRILRRKALVRKLVAAETLGSVTTICTDKTGTLTEGVLSVFTVESKLLDHMLDAAGLLNSPTDPVEIAIREWRRSHTKHKTREILDEIPFSAERKYSIKRSDDDIYMIGAPETVLKHTGLKVGGKQEKIIHTYAKSGYRIIAVARRTAKSNEQTLEAEQISMFEWVGFFVLADQLRKGVFQAVEQLYHAGLNIKVITGDHALTAQSILQQAGIAVKNAQILLGSDFKTLPLSQLKKRIADTVLFARTTPDQKLMIVKTLQARGEVVAMTGDGVNDAPALKQADIGVVVSSASDVSKETADMVLLDDNFSTISAAVEEGRAIYENIKKVILYLLANSFAETIVVLFSLVVQLPLPLTAAQILWVNLATDSFPSMALTIDPKRKKLLESSRDQSIEHLVDRQMKIIIAVVSTVIGIVISGSYMWLVQHRSIAEARTVAFSMLALMSLSYVFSSRTLHSSLLHEGFLKNIWLCVAVAAGIGLQLLVVYVPFLQQVFQTVPLGWKDWGLVSLAAMFLLAVVEAVKYQMNKSIIKI